MMPGCCRALRVCWLLRVSTVVALPALASCHSTASTRPPVAARAASPGSTPAATEQTPPARYVIDPQRSEVLVLVYRDGPMGHLGHNHIISVQSLSGSIALGGDPLRSSFTLDFPVNAMSVDEPQRRAREGADFNTTVDEAAVAGTRDHMLGASLLDAASYATIHLQSETFHSADDGMHIMTAITVRTTTAQVEVAVSTWHTDDRQLDVSGEFDLTHSQLGLTPYSVALGALRVAERMHVRYRLVASRE